MGSAYTPGLKVSANTHIEKTRRLPLKGTVLVNVGDRVAPDTIVARTELPGTMQTVKLAQLLGVEPQDLPALLLVEKGQQVRKGDVLARTKGIFGMFKTEIKSPVTGCLELISEQTGNLGIRQPPTPVEKDAYIHGEITQIIPDEGVVVACEGALIQGIFGVGGERRGEIAVVSSSPEEVLDEANMLPEHAGKIVVGGSCVTQRALHRAAELGVLGIVAGGIVDRDLIEYLRSALGDPSYDIGVAITGQEPIPFTLMVTEGFGRIRMAERTFKLLQSLQGRIASMNGATQIRAGVIRPEVVVSLSESAPTESASRDSGTLDIGTPIRIIREPYFGQLAVVSALPSELQQVESETMVRVLQARLDDGREVTVPRANVEIIET